MGICSVLGVGEHESNELNESFLAPTDFTENTDFLWFGANTDGKDNTDVGVSPSVISVKSVGDYHAPIALQGTRGD